MNGKTLERLLVNLTPLSPSDLDARGRELRKLRMVPSGARGRNAPDFAPEHIAIFIIGVAGADNATHAGRAVMEYAPLVPSDGRYSGFAGTETFADAITLMIEKPALAQRVRKIRICQSVPIAEIQWDQSGEVKQAFYVKEGMGDIDPAGIGGGFLTIWAEIGVGLIEMVGIKLEKEGVRAARISEGGDGGRQ